MFVHLNIHSEFSLINGICRIKPSVGRAKELGMSALAITDYSNLFGMVKFYSAAISNGVKPIVGADVMVQRDHENAVPNSLILLCQNQQGYLNLTRLISRAYVEGQVDGVPIIARDWLDGEVDGLIALSGGLGGDVGQALLQEQAERAESFAQDWQELFPNRFYIELHRVGYEDEAKYLQGAVDLAEKLDLPVVATNQVRFLHPDDFEAHEARVCINSGYTLEDSSRPRLFTEQQYLRSPEEMQTLFEDIPEAIENTKEIALRCTTKLELGKVFLPDFPIPDGMTIEEYIGQESRRGLDDRLGSSVDATTKKQYLDRLELELDVINKMGFPGYFLIVADFIQWAKNNAIPVGPGRGSGAGSLVAYVLKITDLDPIEHELLFERFLNPERVSMPDFDVDFCMEGRDRVIEYVAQKYGRESVSQIITYGTMAAKAVIRDVGRVLGHPYGFVDKIAKLIPFEIGMTLTKALQQDEVLQSRYQDEEDVKYLIDLAMKLEGVARNAGKHAGGVVIAPSKLTDFTPLYCEEGGANLVTQFDKDDVEKVGLVKFDFLGLRTLTIIDWALKNIKLGRGEDIDIAKIPVEDPKVFDLLKACNTTAVFQLESRGMKDLIRRLQPDSFDEIVALVALFRPGPLQSGMVDDFIDRKHGRAKVEYPHPDLEPILNSTYGVILYQEQVMKIAQVLANYSLGAADILRRAMGKKKAEEMAEQREIFVTGAVARDVEKEVAEYIFDLMEKFAGYGFNKSHSAAYALISYQTAWLKTHYPAEFMAAVLSSDMDNTDKVVNFIEDCQLNKIPLATPNINISDYKFKVDEQGRIIHGLGAIKGVGESAIESFVEQRRDQGDFKDLFDLCRRDDSRKVNRRVLEALIRSGSMDSFGVERSSQMASIDLALQAAMQHARNQEQGQFDLFAQKDDAVAADQDLKYLEQKPWSEDVRLNGEKETLGFYISGHPIDQYQNEINKFISGPIARLQAKDNAVTKIAGLVVAARTMMTKRGSKMAFVALEDRSGRIEVAVFSEVYEDARELLVKGNLLVVEGEVSNDEYSGGIKMSAKRIMGINDARNEFAKCLIIDLHSDQLKTHDVSKLKSLLEPFKGGFCPVCIKYKRDDASAKLLLDKSWRIKITNEMVESLTTCYGVDSIDVAY